MTDTGRPLPAARRARPRRATGGFYRKALRLLEESSIPFLVGGAKAMAVYAGIERDTKDLDIFVLPSDCPRILSFFAARGYRTELTHPHWLGKVFSGRRCLDVIYSSGNGLCLVDEAWFRHAVPTEVMGLPVRLVPPEEMLWSKGFILERDRFDGADLAHILRGYGDRLDWARLLERFGPHWRVLLAHLVLYRYIYPGQGAGVPASIMVDLLTRCRDEEEPLPEKEKVCRGTLLSLSQYLVDVHEWGYRDARLSPQGKLSPEEIAAWTAAFPRAVMTAPRPATHPPQSAPED
jgi:hypothetical protein